MVAFDSKILAAAAKLAYSYGLAEAYFKSRWILEDAKVLDRTWTELDALQQKLQFCFYGEGPVAPEAVRVARAMIIRLRGRS